MAASRSKYHLPDPVNIVGVVSPNELRLRCGNKETWSFILLNSTYLPKNEKLQDKTAKKPEKRYPEDNSQFLKNRDALYDLVRNSDVSSTNFDVETTNKGNFVAYGLLKLNGEDIRLSLLKQGVVQLHPSVDKETDAKLLRDAEKLGQEKAANAQSDGMLRSYVRTESRDDSERLFKIFKTLQSKPYPGDVLAVKNAARYIIRLHAPNKVVLYFELDLMGILVPTIRFDTPVYEPKNAASLPTEPLNRIDSLTKRISLETTQLTDQLFGKRVHVWLDAIGMQQEIWRNILLGRIAPADHSGEDISMSLLRKGLAVIQRGSNYVDPDSIQKILTKRAFAPYGRSIPEEKQFLQAEREAIDAKSGLWISSPVPEDGSGLLGLGQSNKTIHIFIDNSNLWIEGKQTMGKIRGYQDPAINDRYYVEDQTWRVDYPRLLELICGNNEKQVEHPHPCIFGSIPPKAEDVWEHCKKCGMDVDKVIRSRTGIEKEVDQRLCAKMHDVFGFDAKKGDVFVLIAGDRDFCSCLETIVKRRDEKPISLYVVSWSTTAMRLKHISGVTYINLDPYRDAITYSSQLTRTLNCLPVDAQAENRLLSVYPQQKRAVANALKGHLTKDRDFKFTKQKLLYPDGGPTIHIVFLNESKRDFAKEKLAAIAGIEMKDCRAVEIDDFIVGTNRFAILIPDDMDDSDEDEEDPAYYDPSEYYDFIHDDQGDV